MDDKKRQLKGSATRDAFKQAHKALDRRFYATDIDFVLVEKRPAGIVAIIDYKTSRDCVTFSEALAYNALRGVAPVFVVASDNPETGPFTVREYLGADWKPEPIDIVWGPSKTLSNWAAFEKWEGNLRGKHRAGVRRHQ